MAIASARAGIIAAFTDSKTTGGQVGQLPADLTLLDYFTDGTSDGQVSKAYYNRTAPTSTPTDLDLAGGVQDFYGATLTFATVKVIAVHNREASGSGKNITIGGAASNAFQGPFGAANDVLTIPPGGKLILVAPNTGWTVTAGTGDLLRLLGHSSGTSIDLVIMGT